MPQLFYFLLDQKNCIRITHMVVLSLSTAPVLNEWEKSLWPWKPYLSLIIIHQRGRAQTIWIIFGRPRQMRISGPTFNKHQKWKTNKQLKLIGGVPMICIIELNSTFLETNDLQWGASFKVEGTFIPTKVKWFIAQIGGRRVRHQKSKPTPKLSGISKRGMPHIINVKARRVGVPCD